MCSIVNPAGQRSNEQQTKTPATACKAICAWERLTSFQVYLETGRDWFVLSHKLAAAPEELRRTITACPPVTSSNERSSRKSPNQVASTYYGYKVW